MSENVAIWPEPNADLIPLFIDADLAAMTMIGIDDSIEDEERATLQRIVRGDRNAFDH